ncbi:hypothetical protein HMI56_005177 [Coelomomyces lativittatus]|nr:hypothetical protein HMI56_005177 [Coelomomyces lativittatus]
MGPKFIPKPPSISKHEIYQSLKEFTRRIAIKDFFNHKPYSTSNSSYHPYLQKPTKSTWSPPFIPSASVRTMIQNLKNDIETLVEDKIPTQKTIPVAWKILKSLPPTVKVVLSDKNLGITLLPLTMYHEMVQSHLTNQEAYQNSSFSYPSKNPQDHLSI